MPSANSSEKWKIRRAHKNDAEQIALLCTQLGYPSTTAQILRRLKGLKPAADHAVFVVELPGNFLGGMLHVSVSRLIDVDRRAEINAMIVREGHRSSGAGASLMKAAARWAALRDCEGMNVRSNVIRERAHKFYERQGFVHYKTQKAFSKRLFS